MSPSWSIELSPACCSSLRPSELLILAKAPPLLLLLSFARAHSAQAALAHSGKSGWSTALGDAARGAPDGHESKMAASTPALSLELVRGCREEQEGDDGVEVVDEHPTAEASAVLRLPMSSIILSRCLPACLPELS